LRKTLIPALMAAALAGAFVVAPAFSADPAYVTDALANKARPKADTDQDALRKPAEMLAFAGIKPGSTVAEWIPGAGYFTRIFGKAVGSAGHLYTFAQTATPVLTAIQGGPSYGGRVQIIAGDLTAAKAPTPVDVVWTSRNYHDLSADVRGKLNKASFDMLKPGGVYIVLDHSAVVGTGDFAMAPGQGLHRIDENLVKLEVMRAGFKLDGESNTLRNDKDTRTNRVFDSSIRGDTDQFILKFRKPR